MKTNLKAVFFDIDGTLVPFGDHGVPEEVREAIRTMRRNGVKVFISTGRHIEWVDNLGDLEFDGFVTTNGALCLLSDKKTQIYRRCIDPRDIEALAGFAPDSDLAFVVVPDEGGIFITRNMPEVVEASRLLNLPEIPVRPISEAVGRNIVQLMAFGSEEERNGVALFSKVLVDCAPTSWNPLFCDIVPKGSDKSRGIEKMLEHFNIPIEEAVAFGDGDNDIEMIRHCGVGVAMGNASDRVKESADLVTTDVRDHGVVNALKKLGLLDCPATPTNPPSPTDQTDLKLHSKLFSTQWEWSI